MQKDTEYLKRLLHDTACTDLGTPIAVNTLCVSAAVTDLEGRLAARTAELTASRQQLQDSEAREEAAFQVTLYSIKKSSAYLVHKLNRRFID